ncbi:MAG: DUF4956 domain-containing protein [Aureliella sp.]
MPEWLSNFDWLTDTDAIQTMTENSWLGSPASSTPLQMALRLSTAFACGFAIATVYRLVRTKGQSPGSFPATLVLLCILCAMLPLVIGQNVAWAFGLVGALSIVRFRTVIEDTHDITFVIFAVLVGMAVGADRLVVAIVGIVVTSIAAAIVRPRNTSRSTGKGSRLEIRIGIGNDPATLLHPILSNFSDRFELIEGSTSKQGVSLDLVYRLTLDGGETDLLNQLNLVDGVQSVKLRSRFR